MADQFSTIEPVVDGSMVVIHLLDRRLVEQEHVHRVDSEIQRAIRESKEKAFVLDFDKVEFMSSAMLGAIITAHAMMRAREARLCVCNLTKDLQKMFKMMKLDTRIPVHKSLEKAKSDLANER